VVVGLNAVREIVKRQPLGLSSELASDLACPASLVLSRPPAPTVDPRLATAYT
jgi:hypothetical protein